MGLKGHFKHAERQLLRPLGRLLRGGGKARPREVLLLERIERLEGRLEALEALEALVREDLGLRYLQEASARPEPPPAD